MMMSEDSFRVTLKGVADDYSVTATCSRCSHIFRSYTNDVVTAMDAEGCGDAHHRIQTDIAKEFETCSSCGIPLKAEGDYSRQARARFALAAKD